jgi:hypothetical protein
LFKTNRYLYERLNFWEMLTETDKIRLEMDDRILIVQHLNSSLLKKHIKCRYNYIYSLINWTIAINIIASCVNKDRGLSNIQGYGLGQEQTCDEVKPVRWNSTSLLTFGNVKMLNACCKIRNAKMLNAIYSKDFWNNLHQYVKMLNACCKWHLTFSYFQS